MKKKDDSIKKPLIFSIVVFIVYSISEKIGYHKYDIPSIQPVSWEEFFYCGLPKALLIGILSFLVIYSWKQFWSKGKK